MSNPERDSSPSAEKAKTILIVDSEYANRLLLGEEFKEEGYRVVCAATGKEALEALRHWPIDLVISDIIHPQINGIELLRLVKESWPDLPFIFNSAVSECKQDFGTWAADEFIVKSSDLEELKSVVNRYLQSELVRVSFTNSQEALDVKKCVAALARLTYEPPQYIGFEGGVYDASNNHNIALRRADIAEALGKIGGQEALAVLKSLLEDPYTPPTLGHWATEGPPWYPVREAAAKALRQLAELPEKSGQDAPGDSP